MAICACTEMPPTRRCCSRLASIARALATVLPDDAVNVFITLTARSLNKSMMIIARGESPSTVTKLLYAGANEVVLPAHIGAERVAEYAAVQLTGGQHLSILRDVTQRKELEREVVEIASQEQRRIGQDLHDSVGQELTALSI